MNGEHTGSVRGTYGERTGNVRGTYAIKLKKCPFCGCKKVDIRIEGKWMMEHAVAADPLIKAEVSCRDCTASVFAFACRRGYPFAVAKDEGEPTEAAIYRAVAKWNRRGGREPLNLRTCEPANPQ